MPVIYPHIFCSLNIRYYYGSGLIFEVIYIYVYNMLLSSTMLYGGHLSSLVKQRVHETSVSVFKKAGRCNIQSCNAAPSIDL